jgi:hypothetical protein
MAKIEQLTPEFVEYMPEDKDMKYGILYISMRFGLAIHLCCCGECNNKTVMPFDGPYPYWDMTNENGLISFNPSVGNFQFPCKSHYFIKENRIEWC